MQSKHIWSITMFLITCDRFHLIYTIPYGGPCKMKNYLNYDNSLDHVNDMSYLQLPPLPIVQAQNRAPIKHVQKSQCSFLSSWGPYFLQLRQRHGFASMSFFKCCPSTSGRGLVLVGSDHSQPLQTPTCRCSIACDYRPLFTLQYGHAWVKTTVRGGGGKQIV